VTTEYKNFLKNQEDASFIEFLKGFFIFIFETRVTILHHRLPLPVYGASP
jgi:hypothetical protein